MGSKYFLNANKGAFAESPKKSPRHLFEQITGHIVHIGFNTTQFGENLRVILIDQENFYCVSMFVSSRPATAFYMLFQNINLNHEVTFKMRAENGKDFFEAHQFGSQVRWAYNKDSFAQLPQDAKERHAHFKALIEAEAAPVLQKKINPYPANPFYEAPKRTGLQGGYFKGQEANYKAPTGWFKGPNKPIED